MKKNRKKANTYRFNGLWGMRPVRIADLERLIQAYEAKLADPQDPDDPKWTAKWLKRFRQELTKKQSALARKNREPSE